MQASREEAEILVHAMYDAVGARELWPDIALAHEHSETQPNRGLVAGGTTSMEDCALLWLLVRYFKRQHVFEIGTLIGTTAVAMNFAVRRNGGVCTTSDPVDYDAVPPYSGIRFIRTPACAALRQLRYEGRQVDFCFMDWIPDPDFLAVAEDVFRPDTIIAIHDCWERDEKGLAALDAVSITWAAAHDGRWFMPPKTPYAMKDGRKINLCTAFFVPSAVGDSAIYHGEG